MKNKKILVVSILIIFILNLCSACLAVEGNENLVTKDFTYNGYYGGSDKATYVLKTGKTDDNEEIEVDAKKFNLPLNLYKYQKDILFRVTYSPEENIIYDCKLVDIRTLEVIEDTTEENINRLYDIEYNKTINDRNWVDEIKLSELNENEIYKYTANSTIEFPNIINDIGTDCVIYMKEETDYEYEKNMSMAKVLKSGAVSFSSHEYEQGESFNIMYRKAEAIELVRMTPKDEIVFLSKYKNGDRLKYDFEKYIYNDTEKDITININDKTFFGEDMTDSVLLKKGEICQFDWMIDSMTIEYSDSDDKENEGSKEDQKNNQNNNDNTQNQDNNNQNSNKPVQNGTNTTQNKQDNTVANTSLPKTGISKILVVLILAFAIIIIVIGKKLKELKDIK